MRQVILPSLLLLAAAACDRPAGDAMQPAPLLPSAPVANPSLAPDQEAQLNGLLALIDTWVASQVLTDAEAQPLRQVLSRAILLYESGNAQGGGALLAALVTQVQRLEQAGTLTSAQASQFTAPLSAIQTNEILFTQVVMGDTHSCGLTPGGYAYCWGDNTYGQLGTTGAGSTRAVLVSATQTFTWIGAGFGYSCALAADGTAWCWGGNISGQLGDGTTTDRATPAPVSGGHAFTSLSVAYALACGTVANGDAYCWGSGGRVGVDLGGLGGPAPSTCGGYYTTPWTCSLVPIKVTGGVSFDDVEAGSWFGCGRTSAGAAHCWGWNQFSQLGDGTNVNALTPVAVAGGPFSVVETGAVFACGLDANGAAFCWGGRLLNFGQIGNGSFAPAPTPTAVVGGQTFRLIRPTKGNSIYPHTCALTNSDEAWCWGMNEYNQLAATASETCNTLFPCTSTPIRSAVGFTFADIATGVGATCGLTRTGEAYCWGRNTWGQLGNGTTTDTPVPTRVMR